MREIDIMEIVPDLETSETKESILKIPVNRYPTIYYILIDVLM